MNEIRMYVERLFQGKTLTDDVIELKEEIYGNLVARYEDYVASGMSEAEALAKTKASITDVEDVLSGDRPLDAASAPAAETATLPSDASAASGATAPQHAAGGPVPPSGVAASAPAAPAEPAPKKKRGAIIAIVAVAAVIVLGVLAFGLIAADEALDAQEDRQERVYGDDDNITVDRDGVNLSSGGDSVSVGSDGVKVTSSEDAITIGSDGSIRLDGELVDDALKAVVNSTASDVSPYVGTALSDAQKVEQAVRALPLGTWAAAIDVSRGNGVLAFTYEKLHELDGDSVDAALIYTASALFCAIPDAMDIQITVSEADDLPNDTDTFAFHRSMLEKAFGLALNGDLVSDAGWKKLKDEHLYQGGEFRERIIDQAELAAR